MTTKAGKTASDATKLTIAAARKIVGASFFAADPIVGAGLPMIMERAARLVVGARAASAGRRVSAWLEEVAAADEYASQDDVWQEIEKHIDTPWMRELVLENFRNLLDSLSERVVPYIAHLYAMYVANTSEPDSFFRGCGRLLSEVDATQLDAVRAFTQFAARFPVNPSASTLEFVLLTNSDGHGVIEVEERLPRNERPKNFKHGHAPFEQHQVTTSVFGLFKRFGLARDTGAGFMGRAAGPNHAVFDVGTLERLCNVMLTRQLSED